MGLSHAFIERWHTAGPPTSPLAFSGACFAAWLWLDGCSMSLGKLRVAVARTARYRGRSRQASHCPLQSSQVCSGCRIQGWQLRGLRTEFAFGKTPDSIVRGAHLQPACLSIQREHAVRLKEGLTMGSPDKHMRYVKRFCCRHSLPWPWHSLQKDLGTLIGDPSFSHCFSTSFPGRCRRDDCEGLR